MAKRHQPDPATVRAEQLLRMPPEATTAHARSAVELLADKMFPCWWSAAIVIDPGAGLLPVFIPVRGITLPLCCFHFGLNYTGPDE